MTEKLGTLELNKDLEYDSGWLSYINAGRYYWKFRFYGRLGNFSKTQISAYSNYIEESRFQYMPFKFWEEIIPFLLMRQAYITIPVFIS